MNNLQLLHTYTNSDYNSYNHISPAFIPFSLQWICSINLSAGES